MGNASAPPPSPSLDPTLKLNQWQIKGIGAISPPHLEFISPVINDYGACSTPLPNKIGKVCYIYIYMYIYLRAYICIYI